MIILQRALGTEGPNQKKKKKSETSARLMLLKLPGYAGLLIHMGAKTQAFIFKVVSPTYRGS